MKAVVEINIYLSQGDRLPRKLLDVPNSVCAWKDLCRASKVTVWEDGTPFVLKERSSHVDHSARI